MGMTDHWTIRELAKVTPVDDGFRVRFGRGEEVLQISLGLDTKEIRHNVTRLRKVLDKVMEAQGGE